MLRGRTGMSPVMIGRSSAVRRLVGLVDAAEVATTDGPGLALVSGEPGIGKTRLLREFIASLPADVTVLSLQAQPGSLGRAFDMVGQLAPVGTNLADPAVAARVAVQRAVQHGRTVLVVEDLHWADADSVHWIEQIAMQPWPRLVLVGTYRPTDLNRKAPGGELVLRLERQHSVEQIRLDRLDRTEVAAMLAAINAAAPSSAAVEAVFRRSGGIPFVVEELMRCSGTDACTDELWTAQLPWSLDEAVRQQLAGLAAGSRRVVDALAVFDDPASFDVLAGIAELDEGQLLDALRELIRTGVLIEPTNDHFWFGHALVADAVSQQLLGRERRRMHERALIALRADAGAEPDYAAIARHASGAGHFDLIAPIAREGARRYLDRGASFQALRLADEGLAEAADDPELLGVATDAAWRLDFLHEALVYGRRWLAVAPNDVERVEAQRFIARLLHEQATPAERDAALGDLIDLARSLPPGIAGGRAYGAVAQIMMLAWRNDEATSWAEEALTQAEANGDVWLHAQALVERGSAGMCARNRASGEAELTEAYHAALQVHDTVLACRALNNLLGFVVPHSERAAQMRADLRAATTSAGFDKLGAAGLAFREATAAYGRGAWRAYRQAITEAEQRGGEWSFNRQELLTLWAEMALEEGRPAAAMSMIEEVQSDDVARYHHGDVLVPRLFAAAQLGDAPAMETAWSLLLDGEPPFHDAIALPALVGAVESALLGGIRPARIRAELFDGWLHDNPSRAEVEHQCAGLLLLVEGDAVGAVAALTAVLDEPDPRLFAPIVATMRTALASAQLAVDDRAGALSTVRRVVQRDLATWPGWRRDRADALLRRLEGSSTRPDGELTPREREVAALIADGLTNGQLAERLYISPKTAAVHVSNILMKLGLSGRAEIAAWAVRHGVVLQPG